MGFMESTHDERLDRLKKLQSIQDAGVTPYADKFERSDVLADAKQNLKTLL